jgi:hypothetical protein
MNKFLPLLCFIALLTSSSNIGFAQSKIKEINACNGCRINEAKAVFYDNGGRAGIVSDENAVTTFVARPHHEAVLFFEDLDLPQGAKLNIFTKHHNEMPKIAATLTEMKKIPNIIGEEIIVEYIAAPNHTNARGWTAHLSEVLTANEGMLLPSQPESDCPNAINLCANNTVVALGGLYNDLGALNDDSGSCYSGTGSVCLTLRFSRPVQPITTLFCGT